MKQYGRGQAHYNCASRAHSCLYTTYRGGWRCGPLEQGGSACWLGGNNKGTGARDLVFLQLIASAPTPAVPCDRNVEYRPGLFAEIAEYVGMTCAEARNFVLATRANPPHPVPPGFVCHDLHVEAGGGAYECVSGSRRIKIENE